MIEQSPLNFKNLVDELLLKNSMLSPFSKFNQLACQSQLLDASSTQDRLSRSCGSFKLLNSSYKDEDFTELNVEFKFLEDLVSKVDTMLNSKTVRLRIMTLSPKTCLSYHKDEVFARWHMPLQTSFSSFFVIEDKFYSMPSVGAVYCMRTNVRHTAINAHFSQNRVHLVGSLIENK